MGRPPGRRPHLHRGPRWPPGHPDLIRAHRFAHILGRGSGVDLYTGQPAMAEQILNCAVVTAAAQGPIGAIMTKFVGGDLVGDFGLFPVGLEHALNRSGGHPPVEPILDERGGGFDGKAPRLVKAEQLEDGLGRRGVDGNFAAMLAFRPGPWYGKRRPDALRGQHCVDVQATELRNPETGIGGEYDDGLVPFSEGTAGIDDPEDLD